MYYTRTIHVLYTYYTCTIHVHVQMIIHEHVCVCVYVRVCVCACMRTRLSITWTYGVHTTYGEKQQYPQLYSPCRVFFPLLSLKNKTHMQLPTCICTCRILHACMAKSTCKAEKVSVISSPDFCLQDGYITHQI